ncbi:MAG: hypothetical protein JXB19_00290 [Bacteroidales bacterium]|nr:hypothetical protein [Bacteroidales bacterium]
MELKSFELLESLGIRLIAFEDTPKSKNSGGMQFWYEGFSDFITLPADIIDTYDNEGSYDLVKLLIDYAYNRGYTVAKLKYEKGLYLKEGNPYTSANSL